MGCVVLGMAVKGFHCRVALKQYFIKMRLYCSNLRNNDQNSGVFLIILMSSADVIN